MKINDDFEAQCVGPINRGIQVHRCSLNVWGIFIVICLEADSDTNEVKASRFDFGEVGVGGKTIPVVTQNFRCLVWQLLAEGEFIDDAE